MSSSRANSLGLLYGFFMHSLWFIDNAKCLLSVDICRQIDYLIGMIVSFVNKHLRDLWETGRSRMIDARMHARILRRLDALDNALQPRDLDLPGFDFHALKGYTPTRYTVHVNGPWCVTFEFEDGDAHMVNYEQYH